MKRTIATELPLFGVKRSRFTKAELEKRLKSNDSEVALGHSLKKYQQMMEVLERVTPNGPEADQTGEMIATGYCRCVFCGILLKKGGQVGRHCRERCSQKLTVTDSLLPFVPTNNVAAPEASTSYETANDSHLYSPPRSRNLTDSILCLINAHEKSMESEASTSEIKVKVEDAPEPPVKQPKKSGMGRFEDKVVIVTGASAGIGRGIAQMFIAEGAKVTITGRKRESLEETIHLLIENGAKDDDFLEMIGDLTNESFQRSVIIETVDKFKGLDILVNNAGGLAPDNTPTHGFDQPIEVFDYVMNLNVRAPTILSKLALKHLMQTNGSIINISGIAGDTIFPAFPYYAASKAALNSLTKNMAYEFIQKGVRVNSVNPGIVATEIAIKQGQTEEEGQKMATFLQNNPPMIPDGRVGTPTDVAQVVAFLADNKYSSHIVGQNLTVDGGTMLTNGLFCAYGAPPPQ